MFLSRNITQCKRSRITIKLFKEADRGPTSWQIYFTSAAEVNFPHLRADNLPQHLEESP